jgi:hypothetical protein
MHPGDTSCPCIGPPSRRVCNDGRQPVTASSRWVLPLGRVLYALLVSPRFQLVLTSALRDWGDDDVTRGNKVNNQASVSME